MEKVSSELENAYYASIKELKEGEIVKGTIVSVNQKEVIIDVGYKAEGIILRDEFAGVDIENMKEVDVYVENVENERKSHTFLSARGSKAGICKKR